MREPPTPQAARAEQGGVATFLAEMLERVPMELLLAEEPREPAVADGLDGDTQDLLADPCGFLRRACQIADYGASSAMPGRAETRRASR
jgi:hypothetical protein